MAWMQHGWPTQQSWERMSFQTVDFNSPEIKANDGSGRRCAFSLTQNITISSDDVIWVIQHRAYPPQDPLSGNNQLMGHVTLAVANILWLRYRCQRRCSGDFHICFNTRETELLLNVPCQDYYTRPQLLYRIDGTQGVACSQCSFQCGPKFIVTEVDVQNFTWEVGPLWGPTISLSAEPPSQLGLDAQKIS